MRRLSLLVLPLVVACAGPAAPSGKPRSVLRAMHDAPQPVPKKIERFQVAPASASKIAFQRIAKIPEPGWSVPRSAAHAPDGKTITFLASESGDETMSLFAYDLEAGKSDVILRAKDLGGADAETRSREEELRRERQRDRSEGITSYVWARRAPVMVVPRRGDVWVRAADGKVKQLTKTPEPEIDARPCDTGARVAFVRKSELWMVDVASGKETQLTTGATEGVTHGLSDYVGQEELGEPHGYFWSPKCDRLVYLEVDERPVEKIPVLGWRGQGEDLMLQRYPRAGAKNPSVRAGILDVATKRTTWITPPADPKAERYVGRFTWAEDGSALFHQAMPRDQKKLALIRVEPATGKSTEIASETSPAWVHFSPARVLERSAQVLFTSIKTGHRHIELRSQKDGTLIRTLTKGDWDVDAIVGLDEAGGRVLFTATKDGPLQRQLYAARLDGEADVVRLTSEPGVHSVRVDETGKTWVDVHSSATRPPASVVVKDGKPLGELRPAPLDPDIVGLGIRPAALVQVPGADGTLLNGALLTPRDVTGRHPVVVVVYGGPESQSVMDYWSPRLLWQHLADRGFVVFQVDGRGTGGRGRAFAQKVHKQLGKYELEDQIAAAKWLATLPYVDASRIGIYGHSYGGFMAALAMLEGGGVFQAGVAGSSVTDWRLYDTGYTERYMETPATNADGYAATDLAKKAPGLTGKLLLTHAMMDENVHYANTARLVDALIAADKRFELLVLPGERHGLRIPAARAYMPARIASFFAENL
ncbi:MAG: alpha/beta fold hydrolase [Labilithrix sp.]|nr:alpha/beta fold hydrolase [Labilithrix sp.]MCW5813909.1 alpha/beta fold hydrolase [Labilithrix sp.]